MMAPRVLEGQAAVLHPDLGVGGAERLIVDASKVLQSEGYTVKIYTSYHDKTRCFEETIDGTLEVITVGQWIPRTIFGKFHALMAYLKMIYIALYLILFANYPYNLILCDQVSACIPLFRLQSIITGKKIKIVFYCHFPDQLLTERESFIKKIYRFPLDRFEEWSTSCAHIIVVNSKFTRNIVENTFKSLKYRELIVLYPCVDLYNFRSSLTPIEDCDSFKVGHNIPDAGFIFLSLNRFERKKNLEEAIEHLYRLKQQLSTRDDNDFHQCRLIIAGGYDQRLKDCVKYYNELEEKIKSFNLVENVILLKSPSETEKLILLEICNVVIYTPKNEHFGIVPLEAMAKGKPVIAHASGGPLETVQHNVTGLHYTDELVEQMRKLYNDQELCRKLGQAGCCRVIEKFSNSKFREIIHSDILFGQAYR